MPFITCCKDCKKRHEACWDTCEEYQAQKKKNDERKAAERLEFGLDEHRWEAMKNFSKGMICKGRRAKK